jgi:predicted O-methyltransferase YrrM
MSNRTIELDDELHGYLLEHSLREADVMRELRERTAELPMHNMQIAPEQGQFMGLLAQLVAASRPERLGAPRFIEVGTFTGYSALAVTSAVSAATVVACDVSEEWTAIAREYWERAGVADRIDLHLRPATETIDALVRDGGEGAFDFAFIDADKTNYESYYEGCLRLLRPGGIVTLDNVLWGGSVADPDDQTEDTLALRAINDQLHADERVDISMVPIGDGLTIARKR